MTQYLLLVKHLQLYFNLVIYNLGAFKTMFIPFEKGEINKYIMCCTLEEMLILMDVPLVDQVIN